MKVEITTTEEVDPNAGCRKFYRPCPKCGKSTHMGFICECGGNPWKIKTKEK